MPILNNIKDVRLRLQQRYSPALFRMIWEQWNQTLDANLREVAVRALSEGIQDPEDADLIEEFCAGFTSKIGASVANFVIESGSRGENMVTKEDVRRWVEAGFSGDVDDNTQGKVLDGSIDTDVDKVTVRMQMIFGLGTEGGWMAESARGESFAMTPAMQAARDKYLPMIADFMNYGNSKYREWAEIILRAWVDFACEQLDFLRTQYL